MVCPYCGEDNLEGTYNCEACMQDLAIFDVPRPTGGLQKKLMEETVNKMKLDRLVIVKPEDSLAHSVSRIKKVGIGQAVVVKDGKLVGILTERDLLEKIAGNDLDLDQVRVDEVMTSSPESIEERDEIMLLINKMAVGGYRHVPICREGQPIGIVSAKAVANYILNNSDMELRDTEETI